MNGKGSGNRVSDHTAFRNNYDQIFAQHQVKRITEEKKEEPKEEEEDYISIYTPDIDCIQLEESWICS